MNTHAASQPLWGVDLGGTKIEAVILDRPDPHAVRVRKRIPTESHKGYDHILHQIKRLIDLVAMEAGMAPPSIGIGTPGTIDPATQTQKNSNTTCLNGRPFLRDLTDTLGVPVHMANDANCFALAEATMGAVPANVPDARVVFGVIMGTGVGGGLVVDGRIIAGKHGIGGEWGHNLLDMDGGPCYCGKTGCVEKVISGPALEDFYAQLSGQTLRLPQILERHLAGTDPHATATLQRLLNKFAEGISVVINIVDPDAIVIGGGVGNIDLLYTEGKARIQDYIFNNQVETPLLKPVLGDSAGVFGAAMLTHKT